MSRKKIICLFVFALLCSFSVFAQTAEFRIKGSLVDSASNQGLSYATVTLKSLSGDNQKSVLTKENGSFIIEKIPAGKYQLVALSVGFKKISRDIEFDASSSEELNLGKITLSSQSKELNEVEIATERPLVKQEVDRITYDVQSDPESKSENVLDMLRKVPLVTVDADDNIQIKGNANFKVLINGRPSAIVARNPKDVFKSMPASSIVKIEVITNPPAKYDAEGFAGVLNIITTQKMESGYNGTVGTWYNFPWGPGANASLTLKQNKFAMSTYYGNGFTTPLPYTKLESHRTGFNPNTQLDQTGRYRNGWQWYYMESELSYEFDTLNLLTGEIGYNPGANNNTTYQSYYSYDDNGLLLQSFDQNNQADGGWEGLDLGLNYQHSFKRNKQQLLTLSFQNSYNSDHNSTVVTPSNAFNYFEQAYIQKNKSGMNEQTYQLDYIHPIKQSLDIEAGLKAITRNNFSEYEMRRFDPTVNDYMTDSTQTNNFDYQQNVYSFYNSYNIKLKKWGIKAGARIEQTMVDANFENTGTIVKQDYYNVIPSLSVQYKFSDMTSMNFGYTQRIQRPSIWELNPYVDQTNAKFWESGNPDLKAVLNHNFELGYSTFKKGSINVGASYSFADNTIQRITELGADTITRTTYQNVGKDDRVGLNTNLSFPINKKLNLNVNGQMFYVWLEGALNGIMYKNDGLQGNAFGSASYTLPKDFKIRLSAGYYTQTVMLQGQSNPFVFSGLSVSKDFWKKSATLTLNLRNPYQKYRSWSQEFNTSEFTQRSDYQGFYRSYGVSFTYRFGKLQNGVKKNERGINNDDVEKKSGGGGQQ